MDTENEYGLYETHLRLIKLLDCFDQICRKHKIMYSLHGGALLGAERNHQLIPWDDDIDVTMTREEFEKFRDVMYECDSKFELDERTMWFPRFIDKLGEDVCYIDLIIYDGISDNKLAQKCKILILDAIQGMMKKDTDYSRFSFCVGALLLVTHGLGLLFSSSLKYSLYNAVAKNFLTGSGSYIHRANDSHVGKRMILNSCVISGYNEIELEGGKYYVFCGYKDILVSSYGDNYLVPPPEKERVPNHGVFRRNLR